jgi:hypothetical protein
MFVLFAMLQMQNYVSCLKSKANQLRQEQGSVQQQVDVFEGLVCVREVWACVLRTVLEPGPEQEQLRQGDQELQQLLDQRGPQVPEHVLQQLPLLPCFAHIDRWVWRVHKGPGGGGGPARVAVGLPQWQCCLLLARGPERCEAQMLQALTSE